MATFNIIAFRQQTKNARNSIKNIAVNAALAKFNGIKFASIKEFEDDKITKEIDNGPTSDNISNTLKGKGNLFSFIGFERDERPMSVVRQALQTIWQMDKDQVKIEDKGDILLFKYPVRTVNLEYLYDITPMPWGGRGSWLQGIEKGISGFTNYIYWKIYETNPPSRSGTGVQADHALRGGEFRPRVYITKILRNFVKRFN